MEERVYAGGLYPSTARCGILRRTRLTHGRNPSRRTAMTRRLTTLVLLLSALIMMAGCSRDPVKSVLADAELRSRVMDAITNDSMLSGELVDKLLQSEALRGQLADKVLGNGDMTQLLMSRVAKDQTMIDGVLGFAAQDSTMQAHLMGVLQGMKMAKK